MTVCYKLCGAFFSVLILSAPLSAVHAETVNLIGSDTIEIPDSWSLVTSDGLSRRDKGNILLFKATAPIMCVIRGTASAQSQSDDSFNATDIGWIKSFYENSARKKGAELRFTSAPAFRRFKNHYAVGYEGNYEFQGRTYPVRELVINGRSATYGFKLISPSSEFHPFCVNEYEKILSTLKM